MSSRAPGPTSSSRVFNTDPTPVSNVVRVPSSEEVIESFNELTISLDPTSRCKAFIRSSITILSEDRPRAGERICSQLKTEFDNLLGIDSREVVDPELLDLEYELAQTLEQKGFKSNANILYLQAAAKGHCQGKYKFACMIEDQDKPHAIQTYFSILDGSHEARNALYRLKNDLNDLRQFVLGDSFERVGELEKAYELYSLASATHLSAKVRQGFYLVLGTGCPTDASMGLKFLVEAAEQNSISAFAHLGQMFEKGMGVQRDLCKALWFYMKGITLTEQGTPECEVFLGQLKKVCLIHEANEEYILEWMAMSAFRDLNRFDMKMTPLAIIEYNFPKQEVLEELWGSPEAFNQAKRSYLQSFYP